MRKFFLVGVVVLLASAANAQTSDARRCLELVQAKDVDAARPVCRSLELSEPFNAQAFGFFQLYGEVGHARLRKIAVQGIDTATSEEKRALESARRYLLVAAENGYGQAQMLLAMTIGVLRPRAQDGLPGDEDEQIYWLRQAAEQDIPNANYQLGSRALSPYGTILERPEFLPYLERAAELGQPDAVRQLEEYRAAARLEATEIIEDPEAAREHALSLWASAGGNRHQALRLMRFAADAGDARAMLVAGKWSWPNDADGAAKYLGMAAEVGDSEAMISLGNFHACRGDTAESELWFRKAQDSGHAEAPHALRELAEWGVDDWDCRRL